MSHRRGTRDVLLKDLSDHCIVLIVGATSSGKTDVVSHLSKRIKLEVISCDSMQVYRSMPVLTQAPSPRVLRKVPHHLVGTLSPRREYNAADFCARAKKAIRSIRRKGHVPFIVGGTGLYMTAFLDGLFEGPGEDTAIRSELYDRARRSGSRALYDELEKLDPQAASKIHSNDIRRIIRALEVIRLTGNKFSTLKKKRSGMWNELCVRIYAMGIERGVLYDRINRRSEKMFREGIVEEVRDVLRQKPSKTAMMCLGIRELKDYLKKEKSLHDAKELLKRNTRRYAKRQLSWFRRDPRVRWISVRGNVRPAQIANRIYRDLIAWRKSVIHE